MENYTLIGWVHNQDDTYKYHTQVWQCQRCGCIVSAVDIHDQFHLDFHLTLQ